MKIRLPRSPCCCSQAHLLRHQPSLKPHPPATLHSSSRSGGSPGVGPERREEPSDYREHCERLSDREHDIRDGLAPSSRKPTVIKGGHAGNSPAAMAETNPSRPAWCQRQASRAFHFKILAAPEVTQSAVGLAYQSSRSVYSFDNTLSPRSAAMLRQRDS
jgi:hypothetical protein